MSQNNQCKICGIIPENRLFVDHCHISGKIRGLLCRDCNIGLGYFRDSEENLAKAIVYLKEAYHPVDGTSRWGVKGKSDGN